MTFEARARARREAAERRRREEQEADAADIILHPDKNMFISTEPHFVWPTPSYEEKVAMEGSHSLALDKGHSVNIVSLGASSICGAVG